MDFQTAFALTASAFCAVTSFGASLHAQNGYERLLFWLAALTGAYLFYFYAQIAMGAAVDSRVWLRPAGAMLSSVIGSLALYEWRRRR